MCYHYKPAADGKQIELKFKAIPQVPLGEYQMTNGYTYPLMPVIMDESPRVVSLAKWGLLPGFAKDDKEFLKKANTLNAKIETAETLASYRNYVNNRCLILADSFKEWKHETINGKLVKTPYEIKTPDNLPFAIAGLYSIWHGQPTFTILTTEANTLMAEIHNSKKRMPVILCPGEDKMWLEREPLAPYCNRSEVELIATPI
jgi:putative SOS response-associated peptidase YedK